MKKAVILHNTDGSPEAGWFPWAKEQLEVAGYEVWVPLLPGNHTPDARKYSKFLLDSEWDFTNNIVIGHSSGAVHVLNMLMDDRFPHLDLCIAISAWHTNQEPFTSPEQFKDLFPPGGYDFNKMHSKANELVFIHGAKDPYCSLKQAQELAQRANSEIVVVPNGKHFGRLITELPALSDVLRSRGKI